MADTNLSGIIDVTLEKLKTMTNAETIIGEPIVKNLAFTQILEGLR